MGQGWDRDGTEMNDGEAAGVTRLPPERAARKVCVLEW